jgi:hypothetical protein
MGILALLCFLAPLALSDDDKKTFNGIHGKIKAVDLDAGTLTITPDEGKARAFKISDDTQIIGPDCGVVPERLRDKRVHPGREVTVIPAGDGPAAALLLGNGRKASITRVVKRRRLYLPERKPEP